MLRPPRWMELATPLACAFLLACAAEDQQVPTSRARSALRGEAADTVGRPSALSDSALGPAADEAFGSEDYPRAEELYRELARRQPNNTEARRNLGRTLSRQEKHAPAIAALEQALETKDEPATRLELGRVLVAAGKAGTALPHLRKAASGLPRDPAAWAALVDVLVQVEKPDGALESARDAKKVCSGCARNAGFQQAVDRAVKARAAEALKLTDSGDFKGAERAATAALEWDADQPEATLAMARIARAGGDDKAAEEAYRKAIEGLGKEGEGDEASASAHLELAALLLDAGDGKAAIPVARQAALARPDNGRSLDVLGRACDATKDDQCARNAYAKLVALPGGGGASQGAVAHAERRLKALKHGHRGKRGGKAAKRARHK